ncbi:MAG TPA: VanZ family protein [Thermoguttaceae bacterium]
MRITFLFYTVYLTILLLSKDPSLWIGTPGDVPDFLKFCLPYSHLLSFALLSALAFAACWPLARWGILFLLVAYGTATEILQWFIPHRHPGWADWFYDIGGIALGFSCFCLLVFFARMMRGNESIQISSSS